MSSNTLWKIAGAVFLLSFAWFFGAACVGVALSTTGVVSRGAANAVAWDVLGMLAAAAIAGLAWLRQYRERWHRTRAEAAARTVRYAEPQVVLLKMGVAPNQPQNKASKLTFRRALPPEDSTFDRPWGFKQKRDE